VGALINLSDVVGESGEPSARAALLHVHSALVGTEGDIERVLTGRQKLSAETDKVAEARQDLNARIADEASSLVEKMRRGIDWTLSQFGSVSTLNFAARLSASSLQSEIAAVALAETAEELARLEAKRERLLVARAGIVREVVRESLLNGLIEDFADTIAALRDGMTRLTALSRFLEPQSHDYRPNASRVAVVLPDYTDPDGQRDQAVVATAAAISKIESVLNAFAEALLLDPRAPVPELEVDTLDDPDTPYHALSPAERAQIDRDFSPQVPQHRVTTDSLLFEEQAAAKAFVVGLTN
jgi:hypothetical protein